MAPSHQPSLNDYLDGEVNAFLTDEGQLHMYDDLTKVNPVTPRTVLKCLDVRYGTGDFYTNAGCTLVAVNPFRNIPHLYSPEVMKEYHNAPQPQEHKPHIFTVAEQAYRNVQGQVGPVNQSIIVSGESGAGKTWTTRSLLQYYATVTTPLTSQKGQDTVQRIEQRVLDSNPVMEAFGNASTSRNSNSSRFGKYIQLQLNSSQEFVGAEIQTFLLEKTRVVCQAPDERNFHIFYQMMEGATEEERQQWHMPRDAHFSWLPNADRTLEEDCFAVTRDAMMHLGIDSEVQGQIFQILAGLLQLGNVDFAESKDELKPCKLQKQSNDFLQKAATMLGLPTEELLHFLRIRTIWAASEQQALLKPCSRTECIARRDCLAKLVYARVFDLLVMIINKNISATSTSWCNFIGLLDVYGFEHFQDNHLEQVCINYANEKLQQHFVRHFLKNQQEENIAEGLDSSIVSYQDNQSCLDLFEDTPNGIFSLFNEECYLNRRSDDRRLEIRLEKALSGNPCVSWNRFDAKPHFIVSHYAENVCYQIKGMLEKNKDSVPLELLELLGNSQKDLVRDLFAGDHSKKNTRGHRKVVTVVSKFKNSLDSLMKILDCTTPHNIRCIKPNTACQPLIFEKEEVMTQLVACGIVASIKISASGFPIRIPYPDFVKRYGLIADLKISSKQLSSSGSESVKDTLGPAVSDILRIALPDPPVSASVLPKHQPRHLLVHCGNTKVFITHATLKLLEAERGRAFSRRVACIQWCWRRYRSRKQTRQRLAVQRRAAVVIQAAVRSWILRREALKWHTAAWTATLEAIGKVELDNTLETSSEELSSSATSRAGDSPPLSPGRHAVQPCSWLRFSLPSPLRRIVKWQRTCTIIQKNVPKKVSEMAGLSLFFRNQGLFAFRSKSPLRGLWLS